MAIDALSLALSAALTTQPAPVHGPDLSLLAPVPQHMAQLEAAGTVQLALASSCSDSPWWTFSGIQLITCMIGRPGEFFGDSDEPE